MLALSLLYREETRVQGGEVELVCLARKGTAQAQSQACSTPGPLAILSVGAGPSEGWVWWAWTTQHRALGLISSSSFLNLFPPEMPLPPLLSLKGWAGHLRWDLHHEHVY